MNALVQQFKVIDTDTHIIEPYDLWTSRVSVKKWGDKVPHVRWDPEEQEDAWYFGDTKLGTAAGAAMAGWHEFPPKHPRQWKDVAPSAWRAEDRLKKMDENGIYAQILYPNVAGFGAGQYLGLEDPELMLACVQAYNDWVAEWAKDSKGRLVPQAAMPFWDMDLCIKEMERAAKIGHKGVILTSEPQFFKQPKLTDPHWDRFWDACQDIQLPVNFHIGSGDLSHYHLIDKRVGEHAAFAALPVLFTIQNAQVIAQLVMGGICHRHPGVNFVSVESGVGWLPFALDMMDWMWINGGVRESNPEMDLMPSEYFKRQIYGCFWFERRTLDSALQQLGPDNLLYESDFPHPTSMSPGPASQAVSPKQYIQEVLGEYPQDVVQKILYGNAARVYHLD